MIYILLFIIGLVGVVFFEHLLLGILGFSFFALIGLNMWGRVSSLLLYAFLIPLGLILDTTMHLPLGTHVLVLGIVLVLFWLIGIIVPTEGRISRYISLFIFFLSYYFAYLFLSSFLQDSVLPEILLGTVIKIAISTTVSVAICFVLDIMFFSVRSNKNFESIRLR
jgi:uncharacterized membrane protein (DUF485 family)